MEGSSLLSTNSDVLKFFQKFPLDTLNRLSSDVWSVNEINRWEISAHDEALYGYLQLIYCSPVYIAETKMILIDLQQSLYINNAFYGKLLTIDLPSLKKCATLTPPLTSVFEINLNPTLPLSKILEKIEFRFRMKLSSPFRINYLFESFLIIESGGSYHPCDLCLPDAFGRLIICLPSKFTGGEFGFSHQQKDDVISFGEDSEENCSWMVVFGNSLKEHLPVTSGSQVIVTYTLKLGPCEGSCKNRLQYSNIHLGAPAWEFQKQVIKQLAEEMEEESLGILLHEKSLEKEPSLEMLQGTNKLMWETLQQYGSHCKVQNVMYEDLTRGYHALMKSEVPTVYSFNQQVVQYGLGLGMKPLQQHNKIPFFDIGKRKLKPDYSRLVYSESDEDESEINSVEHRIYLVPALIIDLPSWWTRARLMWIAKKKNSPRDCPMAILPNDIIRYIGVILCENAVNLKKRKREQEEEEEEEDE